MADSSRALILSLLVSCSPAGSSGRTREFTTPVPLQEVASALSIQGENDECLFWITDGDGRPVPHALLRLDWPERGRMSIQSDAFGQVGLRIPVAAVASGVLLRTELKPIGQDLLAQTYEESTDEIQGGRLTVTVR